MKDIKNKIAVLLVALMASSCGVTKPIVKEEIIYHHKDSTVFNIRDSVVVIPIEKIINITPEQYSELETSMAKSEAYTDTLGLLHHTLENKKGVTTQFKYVDRYIEKTDTCYIKEPIPYEVEKLVPFIPKFYKFTLWWFIISVLLIVLKIYLKFIRK